MMYYPATFGAKGDGVTDDTAALQAWIHACITTGDPGYLSPTGGGGYLISAPLTASIGSLTLMGAGFLNGSAILMKSPTQDGLQIGLNDGVELSGFGFQSLSAAPTAGAAINFISPVNGAVVDRIATRNTYNGIVSEAVSFTFSRLDVNALNTCLQLSSPGDSTVGLNSRLTPRSAGATGVVVTGDPGGLKLADVKINSPVSYAYGVNVIVGASDGDFFLLAPSSIEGFTDAGLIFSKPAGSAYTFANMVISAQFAGNGPNARMIFLPSNDKAWIGALSIVGVTGGATLGMLVGGVKNGVITGCATTFGGLTLAGNNGTIVQGANSFG